jgi:hypothetical protein
LGKKLPVTGKLLRKIYEMITKAYKGLVWTLMIVALLAATSRAFYSRSLRMSVAMEAKSALRREILAQESVSKSKKKWTRVQFPSPESLVKRYASQLELTQAEEGEAFNLDFNKGLWGEIEGEWRLLYTNNAANAPSSSISVSPPPFSGSTNDIEVFRLDSVVQRIKREKFSVGSDTYAHSQVDHILRFELNLPDVPLGGDEPCSSLRGEVVLEHDVKVVSDCYPAKLAIDLRDIKLLVRDQTGVLVHVDEGSGAPPSASRLMSLLRTIAGISGPSSNSPSNKNEDAAFITMLSVPLTRLLSPAILRRGFFEVTYVDDDTRISRGPFGELRVFERMHRHGVIEKTGEGVQ